MSSFDMRFSAATDPILRSVMTDICRHHDPGAKLFASLDDWYVWIKPQYLLQTFALTTAATGSVNLELQPSKVQIWKPSCQDPPSPESQDKVRLTLSCLGGLLQIHNDIEPSTVVLGEQASMEKTTQRLQRIAATLADLNAEGLNAQTVNDLLTMFVGAASQHVLRMSFVPEQEAHNFDIQVFWSHLIQRDSTILLTSQTWGLGFGSAVQRHAAAPWRAWPSVIPTLVSTTLSPDTDTLYNIAPRLGAQLVQLQTTHSLQRNKPAFLLKTTWSCPSSKSHTKEASHHNPKKFPQATP